MVSNLCDLGVRGNPIDPYDCPVYWYLVEYFQLDVDFLFDVAACDGVVSVFLCDLQIDVTMPSAVRRFTHWFDDYDRDNAPHEIKALYKQLC